jgi:hypothetical protein
LTNTAFSARYAARLASAAPTISTSNKATTAISGTRPRRPIVTAIRNPTAVIKAAIHITD